MNTRVVFSLLVFCGLSFAQSSETVLGGPCLPEPASDVAQIQGWHALVTRHGAAARAGDHEAAVDLARQVVRGRCSNEHWWLQLAEDLVETNQLEQAVAALDAYYERQSNAVDWRLRTPESPLHRLLDSEIFQRSELAAKLAGDRKALEQRRSEAIQKLAGMTRPPEKYIAKSACPFEYCRFGSWAARDQTELYDQPDGGQVIARVESGEVVEALTGEVHLRPLPVLVRFESPDCFTAEPGSIVFLLDYLGEGYGRVWVNSKIVDSEVASVHESCRFASSSCWGEFIQPEDDGRQRDGVWWVQIKTRNGKIGWTRDASHFDMPGS